MRQLVEKSIGIISKSIVITTIIAMFFACRNEMKDITAFDNSFDSLPSLSAYEIEFIHSDSARVQVILTAPTMHSYDGEDPYMEFPDGFKVVFHDNDGTVKSQITANYGINYQERELMEGRGNVVVNNYDTEEQLNTEELIWDQRKEKIYSNKFVKITTGDGVLYGDGLESDQAFTNRRIIKPRGEILVDEDEQ